MPNHSSKPKRAKRPADINQLAASIVRDATAEPIQDHVAELKPEKDPAAVSLGRRGGLKGGKARAKSLTPEQRSEIAKKAALARWTKSTNQKN